MAPPLDPRKLEELAAFVNGLADAAGYVSHADWARESGYPATNLSELRNAVAGIDGYNLLRLIRAAAERVQREPQELALRMVAAPAGAGLVAHVVQLERRLDEASVLVARGFEALGVTPEQLGVTPEQPLPDANGQAHPEEETR